MRRSTPVASTLTGSRGDLAVEAVEGWFGLLETAIRDAQAEGTLDPGEDAAQLAFELDAYLLLANAQFVAGGTSAPMKRARLALDRRITLASAPG